MLIGGVDLNATENCSGNPQRLEFEVRDFRSSDTGPVIQHLEETWHHSYDTIVGENRVHSAVAKLRDNADLATHLGGKGARILVACNGRRLAGTCVFRNANGVSYISGMYVHPSLQRAGIGSALLERALQAIRPANAVAALFVLKQSIAANDFYCRRGFSQFQSGTYSFEGYDLETIEMFLRFETSPS